jgi:hypothetical protein
LMYYVALLKIALSFREFQRKDEDYVWLASTANQLGNFSAALRHLKAVKSWNVEARFTKIVALIGVNELESAEREARLLLEEGGEKASPERVFSTLWTACVLFPPAEDIQLTVLRRALDWNIRDAFVLGAVTATEGSPGLRENATRMFSAVGEKYPLVLAYLSMLAGDREAALATLKAMEAPLPLDEILRLTSLIAVTVSDPKTSLEQDAKSFQDWVAPNLPKIRALTKDLVDPMERVRAYDQITAVLIFASRLAPQKVEELAFLCDSLRAEAKGEEAALALRVIDLRFTKLRASLH